MNTKNEMFQWVDVRALRTGLFVSLDLGWLAHPFPTNSFKITSSKQIEVIRSLGVDRVRVDPSRSDPVAQTDVEPEPKVSTANLAAQELARAQAQARRERAEQLAGQQRALLVCERRFGEALRQYRRTIELSSTQPKEAAQQCQAMVKGVVGEMMCEGESAIRLLSESAGDKSAMHPVNVTIVSLLLGKAMGLSVQELEDLGTAAFLHDIGKIMLPDRVRWYEDNFSSAEYKLYQDHVSHSLKLAKAMELSAPVLLAIAQHHEMADGSGFPLKIRAEAQSPIARILALVNRYDNLCNPSRPAAALTPHESLSLIFAQLKARFDSTALSAFIRMMGVYPPGSVVQLVDDRYAMVVSVNSSRPLKPRVIVHEPGISRHDALILDLEHAPSLGIRRSLKPAALPSAAADFLAPRQRVCYFFEGVEEPALAGASA